MIAVIVVIGPNEPDSCGSRFASSALLFDPTCPSLFRMTTRAGMSVAR